MKGVAHCIPCRSADWISGSYVNGLGLGKTAAHEVMTLVALVAAAKNSRSFIGIWPTLANHIIPFNIMYQSGKFAMDTWDEHYGYKAKNPVIRGNVKTDYPTNKGSHEFDLIEYWRKILKKEVPYSYRFQKIDWLLFYRNLTAHHDVPYLQFLHGLPNFLIEKRDIKQ